MDLKQDLELLNRVNVSNVKNMKIQMDRIQVERDSLETKLKQTKAENVELVKKLQQAEKESKDQFLIISEQADVIRKYRKLVSDLSDPFDGPISNLSDSTISNLSSSSLTASLPVENVPMEIAVEDRANGNLEDKNTEISSDVKVGTNQVSPISQISVLMEKKLLEQKSKEKPGKGSILSQLKKRSSDKVVVDDETQKKKMRRLNEIKEQQKIRYPTTDDDYVDTHIGQTIWKAILRCFQKSHGNIVTEAEIIAECGKCLLTDSEKPFLNKEKISQYFTYPFKCKDSDQVMTVREYGMSQTTEEKSWIVLMPEWFQMEVEN